MSDFLYEDHKSVNLDHPDSAIRLACVVHRFRVPNIARKVSFAKSFKSVGQHSKTRKLVLNADDARGRLEDALSAKKISSERVSSDAKRYLPMIGQILLSCKVQPEMARLDEKLVFEWQSGIEFKPETFKTEAIMYDLVMTIVCEGLGRAAAATENSVAGNFKEASRDYAAAAGIFQCLADDHLPKWLSKGSKVDDKNLPSECHGPMAKALKELFMANGQQMAIATVLMRPGKPNYALLAKLCLGVADQLEAFVSMLRKESFDQMSRMDKDFFTLITLQINIQKSLSLYFQGRDAWDKDLHGLGIALVSEATVALRIRENTAAAGVPDVKQTPALVPLDKDIKDLRNHMKMVLHKFEKDNSSVFFSPVPHHVPASSKLQEGLQMKKTQPYTVEEVEPCLLVLPEGTLERSDSDLARELSERMNAGEDL
jgi:hypothetical protein